MLKIRQVIEWSKGWTQLWRALGVTAAAATALLIIAFLALDGAGWLYCEAREIPGCTTLSSWMVARWGDVAMIKATLEIMLAVDAGFLFACWHWWDVARRRRERGLEEVADAARKFLETPDQVNISVEVDWKAVSVSAQDVLDTRKRILAGALAAVPPRVTQ